MRIIKEELLILNKWSCGRTSKSLAYKGPSLTYSVKLRWSIASHRLGRRVLCPVKRKVHLIFSNSFPESYRLFLEQTIVILPVIEEEGSSSSSQKPTIEPYLESSAVTYSCSISPTYFLILSSYSFLCVPSRPLPSSFPTKILFIFLIFLVRIP
jgi:hypothetical protein